MAKNEAKVKFTADTKGFTEQIQKADAELKTLKAELKQNATQMKATGDTVAGLEKKHSNLKSQLELQTNKVEALSNKLETAKQVYGNNSIEVERWRTQLIKAKTEQEKLTQALAECGEELKDQKRAASDGRTSYEKLTDTIKKQRSELDELKERYVGVVTQFGKNSDEAKELAREIENLSTELKLNQGKMDKASEAADRLDRSMDDAGDSAKDAADGFTIAKGAIADLASEAVQLGIEKLSEFIGYLRELPEATRELRQDMSTLETSFDKAGFTAEQATQTWKDLYTIFGEDDRAVEAANLIAKMSTNQEDLNKWVTITQGVWGTYQDSLPVEGLAEAAMESAKTGKVTGVLADALNWSSEAATMFSKYMGKDATTAEEAFNKALSECTTEQERQSLITETMTALYGDAAQKYEEASGSQLAAKEAVADLTLAEAELAESIEPVTSAWDGMKAQLITAVTPAIEAVCGVLEDVLGWLSEHPGACKVLAAVLGTLAVAFTTLSVALGIYAVAQWAANSAIIAGFMPALVAALPIIAAVVAAIAIVAVIAAYWDELKAAAVACWNAIKNAWNTAAEWFKTSVIDPLVKFFKGLWESIQNIWDSICDVVQVGIMFIGSILSAAFQIITLPFRFIWENCKEYVFAAWNWIKEKVTVAVNAVSSVINKVFTKVSNFFKTIWNACKSVVTETWTTIRNVVANATQAVFSKVSSIWNKVKSVVANVVDGVKTKVSNVWNGIKSTTSNVFNSLKSTVSNVWNNIKNAMMKPIETARDKIKGIVDKIKGFFSGLKISLPHIKMPHFTITGKFSLNPPSVPKFKVSWYKMGAIFTKPTLFNTPYGLKGVGEAGAEAVLPIDKLERYVANAVHKAQSVVSLDSLAQAIEDLANRPVEVKVNDKTIARATAGASDSVNGLRSTFRSRGLVLE